MFVSAEKLFQAAIDSNLEGDEEVAYIYFYRFNCICELLSDRTEEFSSKLATSRKTSMELMHDLRESLSTRYLHRTDSFNATETTPVTSETEIPLQIPEEKPTEEPPERRRFEGNCTAVQVAVVVF